MVLGRREDTICAVATGDVTAAISIIRISGQNALSILRAVFKRPRGRSFGRLEGLCARHGFIYDEAGEIFDEVVVLAGQGPHTFTGEDIAEVHCHGGRVVRQRILARIIDAGARLAEPGEFSYRAFLGGRIDLSQAEALDGLIKARSDWSAQAELYGLQGGVRALVARLRGKILSCIAALEAEIDFPEDDVPKATAETVKASVGEVLDSLRPLEDGFRWGHVLREGYPVAIVGRPNVGKSSLLNAILKTERALVSDEPGTTRDVIEESVQHKGILLVLRDTAGLRQATNDVEAMGTRLTRRVMEQSPVRVLVVEAQEERLSAQEEAWLQEEVEGGSTVVAANKSDLGQHLLPPTGSGVPWVYTSAKSHEGVGSLLDQIVHAVLDLAPEKREGAVVTNTRQQHCIAAAREAFTCFEAALGRVPLDVAMTHLYEGAEELGAITGEVLREEVLEEIFQNFCVGK